jgi:hypothetical protein
MKPLMFALTGVVVVALTAGPVSAQRSIPAGSGGGGSAVGGAAGGGGGGMSGGGGGAVAVPRGSAGGGSGAPPSSSGASSSQGSGGAYGSPSGSASARTSPTNGNSGYVREMYGSPGDRAVPRGSRPNPGGQTVGQAVLRPDGPGYRPPQSGGGWYSSYPYYPYYGLAYGLGYYGFYDSWWGWGSPYGYDNGYYGSYGNEPSGRGGLKLKVEPKLAEVYVDGYYMGTVDDFDGTFQKMELEVGAHHIEIRASGYQTIVFDVRIEFSDTVTYRGELQPLSRK